MDDLVINIPKPNRGYLEIQGIRYEVSLFFSANDCVELLDIDMEKETDCISFVRNLIHKHIIGETDIEADLISEKCCSEYIKQFLISDSDFECIYNTYDDKKHCCMRFVLAQKATCNQMMENIRPALSQFAEMLSGMYNNYLNNLKPVLEGLQTWLAQYQEFYKDYLAGIADQVRSIIDVFSNISIPNLSEEDRQKIHEKYSKWGSYGWTSTDFLSEDLLDIQPNDFADANKKAKKILDSKGVEVLFEQMSFIPGIKKADLSELRNSYYAKQYKACALVGFAMIDSKLIRAQGRAAVNRKLGKRGLDKLKEKYQDDIEGFFLLSLSANNLFCCLEKMFECSQNFKTQPTVINRHFLVHGMLHRRVTQRDAIQTVLVVYNLYYLTELLDEVNKNE